MTSRKRNHSSSNSSKSARRREDKRSKTRSDALRRQTRSRQSLVETLEARQLLAGPQLIGVQPNVGELIADGDSRSTAPRTLTFRFDQDQQIDPTTLDGIRILRSGDDGVFGSTDDVAITPGLVTVGDPNENEVVVRFAEGLPDDNYRLEVLGFDDDQLGIVGLRNTRDELFQPSSPSARAEIIDFELRLGTLIESVVPQPVIRLEDGSLTQNRDEIVVYFNEDPLFVENDESGNPTERSAENPRFYQLLLTQDSVRTTDDELFFPESVVYDEATHTARLFFADDINELPGVDDAGGTFRLRIGTAVDDSLDLILPPSTVSVTPSARIDLADAGTVTFRSVNSGEAASGQTVGFVDSGAGGLAVSVDANGAVTFDLGGAAVTFGDVRSLAILTPAVNSRISISTSGTSSLESVPSNLIGSAPLTLVAVGDSLGESLDIGVFGQDGQLTSLLFNESISPVVNTVQLPGANTDPGHRDFAGISSNSNREHVDEIFGADITAGITDVPYNFNGVFDRSTSGQAFVNQITDRLKDRVREVLGLWSAEIGVQFRETVDEGITVALGNTGSLQNLPGDRIVNELGIGFVLRRDPTFERSTIVFSNQADFQTAYGENFTRIASAAIGYSLGLEAADELPPQTLMALDLAFLSDSINREEQISTIEPVFPGNFDVLHGQYLHRPDSNDVDLYRFVVDLDDPDQVGTLTAETIAERLPDSSGLDTTVTLFQEIQASGTTDFGIGPTLSVQFDAIANGPTGNGSNVSFLLSDRPAGQTDVRITRAVNDNGVEIANSIVVDLPRLSVANDTLLVGDVVDALNESPISGSLFSVSVVRGDASTNIARSELNFQSVQLRGGRVEQISRNDDYFGEDSRLIASLGGGVYYIGIAASGNDRYDPATSSSGDGGLTQGDYRLSIKFEPAVDETEVIRDLDGDRVGVPGTPLDGDGDGTPGGVYNFWFQTRPENRQLTFTDNGEAITPGQTIEIVGGNGATRRYEFVPIGTNARPGNIAVAYNDGSAGIAFPAGSLANALESAINSRTSETNVSATLTGSTLTITGERSFVLSDDFRGGEATGRVLFVDKLAGPQADGSLDSPFNNIANSAVANAFDSASSGDIVRIVGNGGADLDLTTEADNFSYLIGVSDTGGQDLEDGRTMEVPQGVTVMVDAGASFKLRGARIGVGSSTLQVDRDGGALQVLGTPRLLQLSVSGEPVATSILGDENAGPGGFDDGSVIFTSLRDRAVDAPSAGFSSAPAPGNWGGLVFRRDLDQEQGIRDLEDEGIFLQYVNHAEIRYGGSSNLLIDSVQQLVNPIQIINLRPTITFNEITQSADAAISAAPNSFAETSFQAPTFQQGGAFTADYQRVGPQITNNTLVDNSINGLFVRTSASPSSPPAEIIVAARFDDIDVVHYLSDNLVVAGQPGGSIQDGVAPTMELVSGEGIRGGNLAESPSATQPNYEYRLTYVDADGFESLATEDADAFQFRIDRDSSSLRLSGLPTLDGSEEGYISRRIYRADLFDSAGNAIAQANRVYNLIANIDATSQSYVDDGSKSEGVLDLNRTGVRGRVDGSLVLDPGLVVKLQGSRIELGQGTNLIAEGLPNNPIVLTSSRDDRFGAGGTFDSNNDNNTSVGAVAPIRGDWSGVYASPNSFVSFDNAVVAYAGGISLIEGGQSRGFVPLELQQADARVANTTFEFNDSGQDGAGPSGREGRLTVDPSVIFARGTQPIIVGNTFTDNRGAIISIDSEALTSNLKSDFGRQTGPSDRVTGFEDNMGPLVRGNRYDVVPADLVEDTQVSGLVIRGGVNVTVESTWDDTDIVHVLSDSLVVGNYHSSGGLRLVSRPDESLVVKLEGAGSATEPTLGTGFTATGTPSDIADRIGGSLHILGHAGAPVVLTSLKDDTVGAGLRPDGSQFMDTNGDSFGSRPAPNDWRSILLDQYSNDRNVDVLLESELPTAVAPGPNGTTTNAQFLGELAETVVGSNDVLRLGFDVSGFLSEPTDVDTYSFIGLPGTQVWIDVDETDQRLDTVIELMDGNGNVLARSDDSRDEIGAGGDVEIFDSAFEGTTSSLRTRADEYTDFATSGEYLDFRGTNEKDAGIQFTLPGSQSPTNSGSVFFFRVRSKSAGSNDPASGQTMGSYRFQVRLSEEQEFPGSVVRYADIRFANHGIHVQGLPGSSPLLGEAQENESVEDQSTLSALSLYGTSRAAYDNGQIYKTVGFASDNTAPGAIPQNLGNLTGSKSNVISVGGRLDTFSQSNFFGDIDFYQFDIEFPAGAGSDFQSTILDIDYASGISRPDTNISLFYDPDGEGGPIQAQLIFFGSDSNIAEDQSSPLGENNTLERLPRGSFDNGDPFIGPVALVEGTYYVGITQDGLVPSELTANPRVRREPINSVTRIVEDRIAPEQRGTALPAAITNFFADVDVAAAGFVETSARGDEGGNGNPATQTATPFFKYQEQALPGFGFGFSPFTAFDTDSLDFSLADSPDIGGAFATGSENTASSIPHVSIDTFTVGADFLRVTITEDNTRVIFDVDEGFNPFQGIEEDVPPLTPLGDPTDQRFREDVNSVDLDLVIVEDDVVNGGFQFLGGGNGGAVPRITGSNVSDGRGGSAGSITYANNDESTAIASNNSLDPFLDMVFDTGVYYFGIVTEETGVAIDGQGAISVNTPNPITQSGTHVVHLSIEGKPVAGFGTNTSLHFDPRVATGSGSLTSQTFDLAGYTAEDLPNLYFNYRLTSSAGDNVSYTVFSDQNPTGVTRGFDLLSDSTWRQNIFDLGGFAGDTGVAVRFDYVVAPGGALAEGLYLDDFVVGFAERGESIFFARGGEDGFSGFVNGEVGEYQLEIRRGTNFSAGTSGNLVLTDAFDTNDRHDSQITLNVPGADLLTDGDTFVLSDGQSSQTFEIDIDGSGIIGTNVTPIRITSTSTSAEVAEVIRLALNQSLSLGIEAASAGGADTETMTDNRLNLFGALRGSLDAAYIPGQPLSRDADGHILMPASLFNGTGDTNYERAQGQVIIDSNKISDVRAIGIWTEPGQRDSDDEYLRTNPGTTGLLGLGRDVFQDNPTLFDSHPFLQLPPVGNSYPGAVRNLPALNDSVLGGLTPGVVITNNTVDHAGLAGIKVEGETRPYVLTSNFGYFGAEIFDGYSIAIDAGGTRVVFEFEETTGAPVGRGGSGVLGGDGWADGHVPIFYRLTDQRANPPNISPGGAYNNTGGGLARDYGYSNMELLTSVHQSINGSILVTNGLVPLIDATIGPDPFRRSETFEFLAPSPAAFPSAAVYLEGVSQIYATTRFQKVRQGSAFYADLAPVADSPQPFARIVNNTIYGNDGTEASFAELPTDEPNDLLATAVDTKLENSHAGPYIHTGEIGDSVADGIVGAADVDFYKVELVVGDRLVVDIDTENSDVDTVVSIFNELGVRQDISSDPDVVSFANEFGQASDHLDPASTAFASAPDFADNDDPFVDFDVLETGTYYVSVSSSGHENFDANTLSGRTEGTGGTGEYQIGLEVYAPRDFVLFIDDAFGSDPQTAGAAGVTGTQAGVDNLLNATFTITQIPDFQPGVPNQPGGPAATVGNQITFQFTEFVSDRLILPNGNVNIPLIDTSVGVGGYRLPSINRAIANAINGLTEPADNIDTPTIPNHESGNGPFGRSGPVTRAVATALGGIDGNDGGIEVLTDGTTGDLHFHWAGPLETDFLFGFGHDRLEDGNLDIVPANTLSDGNGTTEAYVVLQNIANIELSPEAIAAGLKLGPDQTKSQFASEGDQLIVESGIAITGGASPTVINNVIVNAHQSIVQEESSYFGFGKRVANTVNEFIKPQEPILAGNAFQYDETRNTELRFEATWPIDLQSPFDVFDQSISTDDVIGATNIGNQSDNFNFVVPDGLPALANPAGNDFTPSANSIIIDSGINSVVERTVLEQIADGIGIPLSNILAPNRDVNGILRADNPNVSSPGGLGSSIFKDRGSNELADFVGPVATIDAPLDNDSAGVDSDPATGFVRVNSGVYEEFRIQLSENGDASDPFTGIGVDDATVVVPAIPGLRPSGANVTIFENNELLTEGVDYTFNYDETKNVVTLTPLAGIWRNDRSYRITLNNRDRFVLVAPDPTEIADGQQVSFTDTNGGQVVFEFETGYQLLVPETLTLEVPQVGTNAGGLADGGLFTIDDGINDPVVFEFTTDATVLPSTVTIDLPTTPTPTDPVQLQAFLDGIAESILVAIQSQVDLDLLDVTPRRDGNKIVVGAETGATLTSASSGLEQAGRTLGLQIPALGVGGNGVVDGDAFVVSNGSQNIRFEFDVAGDGVTPNSVAVSVAAGQTADDVAAAVAQSIDQSSLGVSTSLLSDGSGTPVVFLNLPADGSVTAGAGQLNVVGISRVPSDGDTITITPNNGDAPVILEFNRTDEVDSSGAVIDDGVDPNHVPIDLTRDTDGETLAGAIANALLTQSIAGLDPNQIVNVGGGQVSIGGEAGLVVVENSASLDISGQPATTGPSTLQVFGPLTLSLPLVGGAGVVDGSVLVLRDDAGNDVVFEFDIPVSGGTAYPGSIPVTFSTVDTTDVLATSLVAAINGANIGITATNTGNGVISLGRIARDRVSTAGLPATATTPAASGVPQIPVRRDIVGDGEAITITQGGTSVRFEFESIDAGGGVSPGSIPIAFQPGSASGDIAESLAAAINNNLNGLRLNAVASVDDAGDATGELVLNDLPGTVVDISAAPTLNLTGVPGGAIPVLISPTFTANEVKQELLRAINSINQPGEVPLTSIAAEDRGGSTFFVSNVGLFDGPLDSYFLPAIKDLAGNALEANRNDLSTQFTLLLPTVGLDFGDAPDPVASIPGRYPTSLANDGARHVVDPGLVLGTIVDTDVDGQGARRADGDDLTLSAFSTGTLFSVTEQDGFVEISVDTSVDAATRDGDTITIDLGSSFAVLEFDSNGRFDEDNFAIQPDDLTSAESIAQAISDAIDESPLLPASVTVNGGIVLIDGDDEDGVNFSTETNPAGILNKGVITPIEVTVTGSGVLEAWIDFNADGDWSDPGEFVINGDTAGAIFSDTGQPVTRTFNVTVPTVSADPSSPQDTYARFRISRLGGLSPTGLALSGEVEDYTLLIVPGLPPQITDEQRTLSYSVDEDGVLQALDRDGLLTTAATDNGILQGIIDPDGDVVEVYADDVGTQTLMTASGDVAGDLTLSADGTFSFIPVADFNGMASFTARVTDRQANPDAELVSSTPLTINIVVQPVNDQPFATVGSVTNSFSIVEDAVQTFTVDQLITGRYSPGPANESDQPLLFASAGNGPAAPFVTSLGGSLAIGAGGTTITYTPPADYNGSTPDTFTYTVVDDPGDVTQLPETADLAGSVDITVNAANDPPRTLTKSYSTIEGQSISFPVSGTNGLLEGDTPGPQDEIDAGQTISLAPNQFPMMTRDGGLVRLVGTTLTYEPATGFSGVDQFNYVVNDNLGLSMTGVVTVSVGDVNGPPVFAGINGDANQTSLTFTESKGDPQQFQFDLSNWFVDPEGDAITFTVQSSNSTVVAASLNGTTLVLDLPAYRPGTADLVISAQDTSGLAGNVTVPVTVNDTPDPVEISNPIGTLAGDENTVVTTDLGSVFNDPDGGVLNYSITRVGDAAVIPGQPFPNDDIVAGISFVGDQMQITLKPNAVGTVEIEVRATDGSFPITDTFTLNIISVPDNPTAVADAYNVPVGSTLVISDPSIGLLRNDSDLDGDSITVDLNSVTQTSFGNVSVSADGTFTYTNSSGNVGETDAFSYRLVDSTGRFSDPVSVTLNLSRSSYQNPVADLNFDVNADTAISALDALLVINLLNRQAGSTGVIPTSELTFTPPNYPDVSGDGNISAFDALLVINRLNRRNGGSGEGEAASAVTTSYAAVTPNLPSLNSAMSDADEQTSIVDVPDANDASNGDTSHDSVLADFIGLGSPSSDAVVDVIADVGSADAGADVDEALNLMLGDELL